VGWIFGGFRWGFALWWVGVGYGVALGGFVRCSRWWWGVLVDSGGDGGCDYCFFIAKKTLIIIIIIIK
jgi:hypothetical protein